MKVAGVPSLAICASKQKLAFTGLSASSASFSSLATPHSLLTLELSQLELNDGALVLGAEVFNILISCLCVFASFWALPRGHRRAHHVAVAELIQCSAGARDKQEFTIRPVHDPVVDHIIDGVARLVFDRDLNSSLNFDQVFGSLAPKELVAHPQLLLCPT